jgi:hypothetical protein
MQLRTLLVLLAFAVAAPAVSAHHSFAAEYDKDKPVHLEGKVTRMRWVNPHAWIDIEVVNKQGAKEAWMIECNQPNALIRRGFTRESLPIGTAIVIDGYQALDGAKRANGTSLTFPDGRHLFIGSPGTGAPVEK